MTEAEIPEDIMQAAEDALWYGPCRDALKLAIARALLAERRRHTVEAQPVPEGWQLVPKRRTNEMHTACQSTTSAIITRQHSYEMWDQMLSAAPTPPSHAEVTPEIEAWAEARKMLLTMSASEPGYMAALNRLSEAEDRLSKSALGAGKKGGAP